MSVSQTILFLALNGASSAAKSKGIANPQRFDSEHPNEDHSSTAPIEDARPNDPAPAPVARNLPVQ